MIRHISDVFVSELQCVFSPWVTAFIHFVGIVVVNVMVSRCHKASLKALLILVPFD